MNGGALNRAEAEAIVRELKRIAVEQRFSGEIGVVTPLRAQANLIEELVNSDSELAAILASRNFAETTIRSYVHGVEHFSQYFHHRPDQLAPEHIRKHQAMLFGKLKYSPNTVTLRLASLRFFYIQVLKRSWSIAETPCPKKVVRLLILTPEEVARLIDSADSPFHRAMLMTLYGTGACRTEAAHLKVGDIDSRRMVAAARATWIVT